MPTLEKLAEIVRGVTFDKTEATDVPGSNLVPVLRAGNIQESLILDRDLLFVPQKRVKSDQLLREGDIVICMSSGSSNIVGKTAVFQGPWSGTVGAFCAIIRPHHAAAEPGYLAAWLKSPAFRKWTRQADGLNIKNIRRSELEQLQVPLPSPPEQRRIVDILDRAASIRRLRRQAQETARQIIPALFVKMFGDPATNPMAWPIKAMRFLLKEPPRYGTMVPATSEPKEFLCLRVANIQDNSLSLNDRKYVSGASINTQRHTVANGDLLLARAIASQDHLGKCFVAYPGDEKWAFDSHVMMCRFDESLARPEYVCSFLKSTSGRAEFLSYSRSSAIQFNINSKEFASIKLPLPPIDRQEEFERQVKAIRQLIDHGAVAVQHDTAIAAALTARLLG